MAGIKFDITGDNRNVLQSFNEVQSGVKQMQRQVEDSGASIEDMFKRIGAVAGLTFAGVSAKEFVRNVMNVRGEFQKLEVAFTTMLQSEEKAESLMNQLVKTAAITPFDLKGVADGAKQLLAFGISADEVNDTLVHLGDIAAGLSIPLGDLVYLYGTTMVQGRMFTQDLRQFQGRGIPIADELAKQFGVAKDKVGELVTAGKVGAEQVKKAIMDMTQEGGRFGGLMEKQSKTITGQISNIEDAIDTMFNNIGKQNEGIINTALSGVSTLVENYEAVGKAIASAVAVYGVYKAAIMTVTAMQALQTAGVGALTVAETAHKGWIVLVEKAQKLLNATMLSNPYVLVATAIAGVVAVMMNMKSQQERVTDALNEYNSKKDEAIAKEEEHKRRIEELLSIAGDEQLSTENRRLALVKLEMQYPSIFKKYDTEAEKLKHILDIKNQIAELDGKKSLSNPANERKDVDRQIKDLENALNKRQTGRGEDKFVGENTQNLMDRLKALRVRRSELDKTISKNNTDAYLANLTGISNDDLQKQINERRNLLAKMQTTGKKYGRVTSGGAKGTYSANELQGQLQILEAEQNKRNEAKYTPAQQKAKAKKALDKAKKALADFDNSTTKYTTAEAEEARKKLTDAVSEAEKEYKKFGGNTGGKTGGKKTDPAKTLKQEQRYTDLEAELERKASRDAIDLEHSTRQAEIDAMEEGSKKTIAQIRLDYDRRKEEIDRGYEDLRIRKIEDAKKLWEANPANNGKVFDKTTVDTSYTEAETENYRKLLAANKAETLRALEEQRKSQMQYLYDYIKEYGSIQDQKAAIANEYEQKIADESDTIQKAALARQRDNMLAELDIKQLQQGLDWEVLFNDLDRVSTKALQAIKQQLRQALSAKDITAENAKVLTEKILEIENTISERSSVLSSMIPALKQRERLTREAAEAQREYNRLLAEQTQAGLDVFGKKINIQDQIQKFTGQKIELSEITLEGKVDLFKRLGIDETTDAGKQLVAAFDKLQVATTDLGKATENATNAQRKSATANELLKGHGFGDIFNNAIKDGGRGAMGILGLVNKNAQSMADFVDKVGLENTDFGDAVHGFADGVEGFQSAIQALSNGDIFGFVNGVLDGIAGFGRSFVTIFGGGGNEDEMEERIAELAKANEGLSSSIETLSARIGKSDSTNKESIDAYQKAIQAEKDWEKNQRSAINSRASEWTNSGYGFLGLGGKSSFNDHMAGDGWYGWDKFNEVLKEHGLQDNASKYNIWNLTPEQMQVMRDFAPAEWAALMNGDGHRNPIDLVDAYIDRAGKIEELTSELNEKLTGYSWEGFLDSYKSLLKDMNSETEDFADKTEEMITNALLGELVNNEFKERIKNLYNYIADAANDGLDKDELNYIRQENESIANEMIARRQNLVDAGMLKPGEDFEQEASSKGFQAMGQDLGEELNGRFTAVQIAGENISAQMLVVVATLNSIASFNQSSNTAVIEIRDMLVFTNSYLEDVVRYAKLLYSEFGEKLDDIVNNTKKL